MPNPMQVLAGFVIAAALTVTAPSTAQSQRSRPAAVPTDACSLMPLQEVERLAGHKLMQPGDKSTPAGGSACTYGAGEAQIVLFSGPKSEEQFERLLLAFKRDKEPRQTVSGVGERAYAIFPTPRNKYEAAITMIVARVGQHTVGVSVASQSGGDGRTAQPQATALAKAVVAKLQ